MNTMPRGRGAGHRPVGACGRSWRRERCHLRNLGDFGGDGRDDVLVRHEYGRWHFHPMDGRAVLTGGDAASLTTNFAGRVVGINDFDSDGRDDVMCASRTAAGATTTGWTTAKGPSGGGGVDLTTATDATVAGIGDMNGDGRGDVLIRDDGSWHYYALDGPARAARERQGGLER